MKTRNRPSLFSLASIAGFATPITARFADGDTPTGEGAAEKTGGGDGITLSRKDYDNLVAAKTKLTTLEPELNTYKGRWDHTTKMLRGDLPAEERAGSMQTILKDAGYTQAQIAEYMQARTATSNEPEDEPLDDPRDAEIAELKKASNANFEQLRDMRLRELRSSMDRSAMETIAAPGSKLGAVLTRMKTLVTEAKLEGEDASEFGETMAGINNELKGLVQQRLSARRAATGRFDESWIGEEMKTAGDILAKKYRPLVIAVPNKIGRSAETDGAEDYLASKKPVEAPKYKEGMTRGQVETQSQDWAVDALLRSVKGSRETSPV